VDCHHVSIAAALAAYLMTTAESVRPNAREGVMVHGDTSESTNASRSPLARARTDVPGLRWAELARLFDHD
jgi:hypothetical protein